MQLEAVPELSGQPELQATFLMHQTAFRTFTSDQLLQLRVITS